MQKNYKFKYGSSKKSQEALTRFNYCLEETIPELFAGWETPKSFQHIKVESARSNNQVAYFYTHNLLEGEFLVDQESLMYSMKTTYLQKANQNDTILKVNDQSFRKMSLAPSGFFGGTWECNEVLDFVLVRQEWEDKGQRKYQFYIIHHCHSEASPNSIKWLNVTFV